MSDIVINGTTYNGIESITVKDISGSDVKYTKGERPAGTIEITENGVHDVTNYESANVNVATSGGVDRLQWKCDNIKSLSYEFDGYEGDLSVLEGLDTSQVVTWAYAFRGCTGLKDISFFSFENAKVFNDTFRGCTALENAVNNINSETISSMYGIYYGCSKLTGAFNANTPNCTSYYQSFRNSGFSEVSINTDSCDTLYYTFYGNKNLKNVTFTDTSKVTNWNATFQDCSSLEQLQTLDLSSATSCSNLAQNTTLKEIHLTNSGNVTNFNYAFYSNAKLETVDTLDVYKCTDCGSIFYNNKALTNLRVKNVRARLTIGSGSTVVNSWGHLLTNASLLNVGQELWDNTDNALGGTRKLSMATASKTAIKSIYVKLVDVTDEMTANDQYIANKKPCIECASTDEGAMTLEEYIISKNWQIA